MPQPPIDMPSITDEPHTPMEQLQVYLNDPHSEQLRRRFFGVLASMNSPADVTPWLLAARQLYERGVIDDDGWVYFAAIFLECLTYGDAAVDAELVSLEAAMDDLDRSYVASDEDDGVDDTPEMRALHAAYDARAHVVEATYLRELGFNDLADDVELKHDAFVKRSSAGAAKLFDEEDLLAD